MRRGVLVFAVVLGRAREVTDPDEKLDAMRVVTEHVAPGRWDEARRPSTKEIAATKIVAIPIEEASAKVRTGPPKDDDEDHDVPVWAGVLPVRTVAGEPVEDSSGATPTPALQRLRDTLR